MFFKNYPVYVCLLAALMITGCGSNKTKFDRTRWDYGDGLEYPNRDNMVDDIVNSQMLIGKRYAKVIGLLHSPQEKSGDTLYYEVFVNYNLKQHIHKKLLVVIFNKDSIATSAKVKELDLK